MPLRFASFAESHLPAVSDFNRRMTEARAPSDFLLPTTLDLPRAPASDPIQWTRYVVLDGDFVRGGLLSMDQPAWLNGRVVRAVNFQSPLSEGIADPKYSIVATQMVKFMQRQADATFMVGMGATDRPLPKLLTACGWSVKPVPFLFRVHRAGKFLCELQTLRSSAVKRIAAQMARFTGIGALGLAITQRQQTSGISAIRQVKAWGEWADTIWEGCRGQCSFAVQRDRRTLESLYPIADDRMKIFVVENEGRPLGWSVCFNAALKNDRYFGNMQLGSILDCMAVPDAMTTTAILVDHELGEQGADLVLVNHSHAAWVGAFRAAGFLNGPSNYLLGMSKKLTEALCAAPDGEARVHVTRGDGDGRIHLA